MTNTVVASTSPPLTMSTEFGQLETLCKYISQTASRIRLQHLSSPRCSADDVKLYRDQLLSIAESVEGSAILLESLLAVEQRNPIFLPPKNPTRRYTREALLKLRAGVTPSLSEQMGHLLYAAVEGASAYPVGSERLSRRDIRVILT